MPGWASVGRFFAAVYLACCWARACFCVSTLWQSLQIHSSISSRWSVAEPMWWHSVPGLVQRRPLVRCSHMPSARARMRLRTVVQSFGRVALRLLLCQAMRSA
ncbi:hypothetical protein ATC03_08850 [Agromyces aureus]|uniref:Uncharacterized protein n=1 Tax=Agromyces aureus TaxID=453304 RepID=A0A191WF41_9MICO|nr:hypothetical protein ATC03_08850 [Agromyces aureus]